MYQFISSSKTLPPIAICKTSQRNFWRVHSGQSSQAYITANIISIIRESKLLHRYPVTRPRASALTHKGVTTVLYIFQRKHASTASKFFNKPVKIGVTVATLVFISISGLELSLSCDWVKNDMVSEEKVDRCKRAEQEDTGRQDTNEYFPWYDQNIQDTGKKQIFQNCIRLYFSGYSFSLSVCIAYIIFYSNFITFW